MYQISSHVKQNELRILILDLKDIFLTCIMKSELRIFLFIALFRILYSERVQHNEELLGPLPSLEVPKDEFGRASRRGKTEKLYLLETKGIVNYRVKQRNCHPLIKFQKTGHSAKLMLDSEFSTHKIRR